MQNTLRLLAAAILITLGTGCGILDPDDPRDSQKNDFESAQHKWNGKNPHNYSFTYRAVCFCASFATDSVRVEVRADTVATLTYIASGEPVPAERRFIFPTVNDLFDVLEDAFVRRASEITATYDATYGFPKDVGIDYSFQIADEEYGWVVSNFTTAQGTD